MQGKKMKVWLTRDCSDTGGGYSLFLQKPTNIRECGCAGGRFIVDGLCSKETKKIMGLTRQLKAGKILTGTIEFKWKEGKCKTKT